MFKLHYITKIKKIGSIIQSMILYRDMLNIDPIHIDVQQPEWDDCESKMTGKKTDIKSNHV